MCIRDRYYDWSEKAVYNLKKLITNCDAEIVISSDWKRTRTLEELKLLFRLHGLDEYITDMTSYTDSSFKNQEIRLYLDEHPKLRSYVVIDDVDMEKELSVYDVISVKMCIRDRYRNVEKYLVELSSSNMT